MKLEVFSPAEQEKKETVVRLRLSPSFSHEGGIDLECVDEHGGLATSGRIMVFLPDGTFKRHGHVSRYFTRDEESPHKIKES